jgi:cellobiose phosphorylase
VELIRTLIFQQVRNVLMNKTFHEVLDHDTGRAWRWPGLPWHAAGFMGYIVNGVFGLRYDTHGLHLHPCVPREFDGAILSTLRYRDADYVLEMHGSGTECTVYLDGQPLTGPFGQALTGQHKVDIYAK